MLRFRFFTYNDYTTLTTTYTSTHTQSILESYKPKYDQSLRWAMRFKVIYRSSFQFNNFFFFFFSLHVQLLHSIPKKKKSKKAKWVYEEALQIAKGRREAKMQGRKAKVYPTKCRFPKNSTERQEGLLQWTVYKYQRKNQKGKD